MCLCYGFCPVTMVSEGAATGLMELHWASHCLPVLALPPWSRWLAPPQGNFQYQYAFEQQCKGQGQRQLSKEKCCNQDPLKESCFELVGEIKTKRPFLLCSLIDWGMMQNSAKAWPGATAQAMKGTAPQRNSHTALLSQVNE